MVIHDNIMNDLQLWYIMSGHDNQIKQFWNWLSSKCVRYSLAPIRIGRIYHLMVPWSYEYILRNTLKLKQTTLRWRQAYQVMLGYQLLVVLMFSKKVGNTKSERPFEYQLLNVKV